MAPSGALLWSELPRTSHDEDSDDGLWVVRSRVSAVARADLSKPVRDNSTLRWERFWRSVVV